MTNLQPLIIAALMALPVACFWIAWEARGIRERVGGIQQALSTTGYTARAAMVRADVANRRLDAFERILNASPGIVQFNRRNRDEKT